MKLIIHKLITRVILYFHRWWWLTYTTTVVFIVFKIADSFGYRPASFQDVVVMIGALAVLAISIRQHKDASKQITSNQLPEVVRNTSNGNFEWKSSLLGLNNIGTTNDNLLRIQIMGDTYISDLKGYILYEGYLYPVLFSPMPPLSQDNGVVSVPINAKQTWARDQFLYVYPDTTCRQKVKYAGSYYCISFETPFGEKYFLEENHEYKMNLRLLEESRPKWKTDFLFDFRLDR